MLERAKNNENQLGVSINQVDVLRLTSPIATRNNDPYLLLFFPFVGLQTVQLRKSLSEEESEIDVLRGQLEAAATAASAAKTASDRRVNELVEAIRTGQEEASSMHKQMVDVQKQLADVQLEKQALQKTIDELEESVRSLQPNPNLTLIHANTNLTLSRSRCDSVYLYRCVCATIQ